MSDKRKYAMYYELRDVEVGHGLARYHEEQEMAALVKTLLSGYGDSYANALDLTIEDDQGVVHKQLSGQPLIVWVEAIKRALQTSEQDDRTSATKARLDRLRQRPQRSTSSTKRPA
ncbi:MAG TPA: hypothetical protein VFL82_10865 [Thermomicrobiales bacterium]|jgi:hypothetical protein|nr:hypothetical protein [Thermomicrobiales bacterium]